MTTPPLFLVEEGDVAEDHVVLSGAEGRHAATVRRLVPGEAVDLADGRGTRLRCVVTEIGSDGSTVVCAVRERDHEPVPEPRIRVVQALPKGDRGELAVELMTEAGVDLIVPWQAERCVARWKGDRGRKSLRKWRDTAREAAKQARRSWVPPVAELAGTSKVADLLGRSDLGVVLHQDASERLATTALPSHGEITVVVGPEGGFTDAELAAFGAATRVILGPSVLRTSTAGIAAVSVLQARCGRW